MLIFTPFATMVGTGKFGNALKQHQGYSLHKSLSGRLLIFEEIIAELVLS